MRYLRVHKSGTSRSNRRGKFSPAAAVACLTPRRMTHLLAILALLAQSFVGLGQAQARLADQAIQNLDQRSAEISQSADQNAEAEKLLTQSTPFSSYIVVCTPDGLKKISLSDSAALAEGNPLSGQPDCPVCIPAVQAGLAVVTATALTTGFPKLTLAPPALAHDQAFPAAVYGQLHSRAPPLFQA
ncbi:hypothetical protein ACTL6U_05980 [Rhodovibrionaceae bacterium A322]